MKAKALAAVMLLGVSTLPASAGDYDGVYAGRPTTSAGGPADCPNLTSVSFRVSGSKINFTHDDRHIGKVDEGGIFSLSAPGKAPGQSLSITGQIAGGAIKGGKLTMIGGTICRYDFDATK